MLGKFHRSLFVVAFLAFLLALPLGAQENTADDQANTDQATDEQEDRESRRLKRLRDSLTTSSDQDWVPTIDGGDRMVEHDRKIQIGNQLLEKGDLITPADANAVKYFNDALEIDPNSPEAQAGIDAVAAALLQQARAAADVNNRQRAIDLIASIRAIRPNYAGLASLERQLSRADEVEQMLTTAREQLAASQLIQPEGDNAWETIQAIIAIDSGNEAAAEISTEIKRGMQARAEAALNSDDFEAAFGVLDQADALWPDDQDLATLRVAISQAQQDAWQTLAEEVSNDIGSDRLEAAASKIDALKSSGFAGDIAGLEAELEEARILRSFNAGDSLTDPFTDGSGSGPQMIIIGRGEFEMGSPRRERGRSDNEGPQQRIQFNRPFAMGVYEVTVGQFRQFISETGYVTDAEKTGSSTIYNVLGGSLKTEDGVTWSMDFSGQEADDETPVVHVSWNDANAYASWLSEKTGQTYRLPSEAEFEYALRAGTDSEYWWGDGTPRDEVENLTGDGDKLAGRWEWPSPFRRYRDNHWGPAPIGTFVANPFGLFDIGGNAMEWVADCYSGSLEGIDPNGAPRTDGSCNLRVLKGGSWASPPDLVRSAYRSSAQDNRTSCLIGFRVVRAL